MTPETQLWAIEKRLENIEALLKNLQPKPKKKLEKIKIPDNYNEPLNFKIQGFAGKYAPQMIIDFLSYWEEGERWKKQKVFDIGKRLERWKRQQEKWDYERSQKQQLKSVDERPVHREYKEVEEDKGFSKINFKKYEQNV